jgi:hypothetical protein
MADRDELLAQGPRTAPEAETADERTHRVGKRGVAVGAVAGGTAAVKFGGLAKAVVWLFAWHGALSIWRLGGWIALALAIAAVALFVAVRARREN